MRRAILLSIATSLIASAAAADTARNCSFMWWGKTAAYTPTTMTYPDFLNMCLSDTYKVPAAWNNSTRAPAGVTGKCVDGAWTTETTRQDACIMHGGIDTWYRR